MKKIALVRRGSMGHDGLQTLCNAGYTIVLTNDIEGVKLSDETSLHDQFVMAALSGIARADMYADCYDDEQFTNRQTSVIAMAFGLADAVMDRKNNPLAPRWVGEMGKAA